MVALVIFAALLRLAALSDELNGERVRTIREHATFVSATALPGDTLWSLAESHPLPGCTTGEVVDIVMDVNGLHDTDLVVGQSLLVPCG